jgi:hypothetical protein
MSQSGYDRSQGGLPPASPAPRSQSTGPLTEDESLNFKKNGAVLIIQDTRGNNIASIGGDPQGEIQFKSFLTNYTDEYSSNWNQTEVYGRMDPIHTFQNTLRIITVSFAIPSTSYEEGMHNFQRIQTLQRLMYPNYETTGPVSTLSEAPVFKVKFANLIQNSADNGGLHCVIPSVQFNPNIDIGFYASPAVGFNHLVPKEMSLDLTLNVLHSHELGFENNSFRISENSYPYGTESGKGSPSQAIGIEDEEKQMSRDIRDYQAEEQVLASGAGPQMSMVED